MKNVRWVGAVAVFSFFALVSYAHADMTACGILPSGLPAPKDNVFSIKEDVAIGERVLHDAMNVGLFRDPVIEKYFSHLLEKLFPYVPAYAKDFQYSFFVLPSEVPGASGRAGGIIMVSLGELIKTPSDDYLAFTLAHEVGHVALRHETRIITLEKLFELEAFLLRQASERLGLSQLSEKHKKALSMLQADIQFRLDNIKRVEVEHEFEADRFAASVSARAGFNLASTIAAFKQQAQTEQRGWVDLSDHSPSFLRALLLECETRERVRSESISLELREVKKRAREILSNLLFPKEIEK